MEDTNRFVSAPPLSKLIYFETLFLFMSGNFIYHQRVFRQTNSRALFTIFMGVNAVTSYNIALAGNLQAHDYFAAGMNNQIERNHRKDLTAVYRKSVITRASQQ